MAGVLAALGSILLSYATAYPWLSLLAAPFLAIAGFLAVLPSHSGAAVVHEVQEVVAPARAPIPELYWEENTPQTTICVQATPELMKRFRSFVSESGVDALPVGKKVALGVWRSPAIRNIVATLNYWTTDGKPGWTSRARRTVAAVLLFQDDDYRFSLGFYCEDPPDQPTWGDVFVWIASFEPYIDRRGYAAPSIPKIRLSMETNQETWLALEPGPELTTKDTRLVYAALLAIDSIAQEMYDSAPSGPTAEWLEEMTKRLWAFPTRQG